MSELNKEKKYVAFQLWRKRPHYPPTFIQRCDVTKELPVGLVIHIFSDVVDRRDDKAPRCHCGLKSVRMKPHVWRTPRLRSGNRGLGWRERDIELI